MTASIDCLPLRGRDHELAAAGGGADVTLLNRAADWAAVRLGTVTVIAVSLQFDHWCIDAVNGDLMPRALSRAEAVVPRHGLRL